jgi:hypothetical protein
MSLSRWQKLRERMTAKVVLLAEAVEIADEAGAACAANVPSLIFTE